MRAFSAFTVAKSRSRFLRFATSPWTAVTFRLTSFTAVFRESLAGLRQENGLTLKIAEF